MSIKANSNAASFVLLLACSVCFLLSFDFYSSRVFAFLPYMFAFRHMACCFIMNFGIATYLAIRYDKLYKL